MKIKKYMSFLILSIIVGLSNVSASSLYVNDYGVQFTNEQYDYITKMFYDGYQNTMTQDEFNRILNADLFNEKVTIVSNNEVSKIIETRSTQVTQNGRTTKIVKSCTSSECLVTITATWSLTPSINSWDVIGFRLTSGTINNIGTAKVTSPGYSISYPASYAQTSGNGFGHSVQLGGVPNMKVSTYMYCSVGGTAYGSYQHAMSNVSNATSKLYTIGAGGYGYVFNFYGAAVGKYDGATGVYISL